MVFMILIPCVISSSYASVFEARAPTFLSSAPKFSGCPHFLQSKKSLSILRAKHETEFSASSAWSVSNYQIPRKELLLLVKEEARDTPRISTEDCFVFGLEGSRLERPKGKSPSLVIDNDTLKTRPHMVVMVLSVFLLHGVLITHAAIAIFVTNGANITQSLVQLMCALTVSWLLADLGSGVLHWSVDNYGDKRTPVVGSIVTAFQGHHSAPWTITKRGFFNNIHKLSVPFGLPAIAIAVGTDTNALGTIFMCSFCAFEMLSQELHKWAHTTSKEVPYLVNRLQECGIIVSRKQHAEHHRPPYAGKYCIVSGAWNEILDSNGVFRRLEHIIFKISGEESNSWKLDQVLRGRTLSGNYTPS